MGMKFLYIVFLLILALPAEAEDKSERLRGEELKNAQAMNGIYARHMLSSSCIERQIGYYLPSGISQKERELRINTFKKSCECISEVVLKSYPANDVIDYVTQKYGSSSPSTSAKKSSQSSGSQMQKQKFAKMSYLMNIDKETRKSCGLQK